MDSDIFVSQIRLHTVKGKALRPGLAEARQACTFVFFCYVRLQKKQATHTKRNQSKHTNASARHKNKGASVADEEGHLVHLPVDVVANLSLRNLPRDRAVAETRSTERRREKARVHSRDESRTRKSRSPSESREPRDQAR